ncbi:DNA-binding protein [Pseudozyma hubeiensis SY62]|uniref:DNA replication ATP-dependent helicase/nuclease DNA2 n=1 Tax=Pseudozyma hubeiensis (strain SY62) TaxID=1305764 RepID=R9P446_PSEHS|nr:DNA-binding protein [Pseudozyma hubeiensis SY62]GAC92835.1 DNA-binding protein [Pseudozyma hubeiensis SY62]
MALDAADAHFMDELFADLDASHFSIPPSQSPPKKKLICTPPLSQELKFSPHPRDTAPVPSSRHPRSPLKNSTRFQSQPKIERDLEDWFRPSAAVSKSPNRRVVSASGIKRQKVEHSSTLSTPSSSPTKRIATASSDAASTRHIQSTQKCMYTRAHVVAIVDSSYEVAPDGPSSSKRTRPEKVLVLETDKHSSNINQTSPSKKSESQHRQQQQSETLLAALRDDWLQTLVSVGSIVHLVGQFEQETSKIPVDLDEPDNSVSRSKQDRENVPEIEVAIDRPGKEQVQPIAAPALDDDDDDDLWDDVASMPSLSQCATQELLASDNAPRAKLMIFASRSAAVKGVDTADHALGNLLVVHPDVLVPATKVADVASCIRKPVVQDRLRGASDVTLSLVMGNMLHELLQACLTASSAGTERAIKSIETVTSEQAEPPLSPWPEQWQGIGNFSRYFVEQQVEQQVRSNIESLYAIDLSADNAAIQLREKAAPFVHFARTFLSKDESAAFHAEATLRESGRSSTGSQAKVRLRRILDVEEEIWSPVFGLKGKVDVSVECDILEAPELSATNSAAAPGRQRHAFLRGDQGSPTEGLSTGRVTTSVVPLELKTGRAELVSTEHRAQTMMYTLMMSDRYGVRVNDGLLYYSKSGELHRISRSRNEVRSLIIGRNELAHYLRHDTSRLRKSELTDPTEEPVQVLPPTIDSEHKCRRCYAVDGCMLFRRAVENIVEPSEGKLADIEGRTASKTGRRLSRRTPIADVFEQKTEHLTDIHLDFYRKWDRLLNLEEEDAVRFRREMWTMTAEQREKVGRCFGNMRLEVTSKSPSSPETPSAAMKRVVHRFVRHYDPTQNANAGLLSGHITINDPVTISIEPDMLSVAQGFVISFTPTSVEIGLDHPLDAAMRRALAKIDASALGEPFDVAAAAERIVFRVDKDELGSGMGRIRANLAALFLTPQRGGDVKRRELVVDMRPPRFLRSEDAFAGHSGQSSFQQVIDRAHADPSLNEDQKVAIDKVLTAQDYALVLGMPGTGKTTTIAKLIELLVKLGKRILLTSYTHSAVDTILRKLGEDESKEKDSCMRILRLGSKDKVHPDAHRFLLPRCSSLDELKDAFESPNVVAATCLSVHHTFFSSGLAKRIRARSNGDDAGEVLPTYLFDYCIVDEASQIPLPTCLGPLRFADKFVLVGDHHQLPPLVKNAQAKEGGLDISLFKLLSDRHGAEAMVALRSQYRMNDDIMRLSNEMVYDGQLRAGSDDVRDRMLTLCDINAALKLAGADQWMADLLRPEAKVRLLDTSKRMLEEVGESKHGDLVKNHFEAELIVRIASTLIAGGCRPDQIAVVTPYRQQLKLLRLLLDKTTGLDAIELLTADQSQGRDKDVILVSFARANYACTTNDGKGGNTGELLNDLRRLNVTLTRAKRKLVLVGHVATLEGSKVVKPLLRLCEREGWTRCI